MDESTDKMPAQHARETVCDSLQFSKPARVRLRVLIPIMAALLILSTGFVISLKLITQNEMIEETNKVTRATFRHFQSEIQHNADSMKRTLQVIAADDRLRAAFLTENTAALLRQSQPILKRMHGQSRITHFYFLTPERKCFLRVHFPERRGDIIDRLSAKKAALTGQPAHGIELGPLGTFTLRVVVPWRYQGQLIGYLELGEEIKNITDHLHEMTELDFYVTIHKEFLVREQWEAGMKVLGRKSAWDLFPSSVITYQTLQEMPLQIKEKLSKGGHGYEDADIEVSIAAHDYRLAFLELKDAGDREIGDLIALHDVTAEKETLKNQVLAAWIICLAVGAGLFFFFYAYLGRVDKDMARHASTLASANNELRESEEKYRSMMAAMNDAVYICSPEYRITYMNPTMAERIGADKIGEKCYRANFQSDEKCPWCVFDKVNRGKHVEYEFTSPLTNRYYVVSNSPIFHQDGSVSKLAIVRDITEVKKLERQLLRAQKMEAIGSLAGGVAHDLNNVLSGLINYPELLLMDMPDDNPYRKHILKIQKAGEKSAAIVQDLLTLARRGVAVTEIVNLKSIVREYLESAEFENLQRNHPNVRLKTHFDSDLLNVPGSPVHLSKTVMNLVSNATEAIAEHGTVRVSAENIYIETPVKGYDTVEKGDYVVLKVTDSGSGISREDMDKIFEPFYTKKVMGRSGTGLGMTVVWGTVKDHKGYIDVHSVTGKGTTFCLYFPTTRQKRVKEPDQRAIKDYMGNGEHILVVDDVTEQREIAENILNKLNYAVTSVSSGEQAVEYIKNNSTDLMVLDMIMAPGIGGFETYQQIIALQPGQKAVIVSGFSETEHVRQLQAMGAGKYIKKPYTLEKIGLAVQEALGEL